MAVDYTVRDGVAVITLDNPPVNGLGHATRAAVASGIERANADSSVEVVVIIGAVLLVASLIVTLVMRKLGLGAD